MPLYRRLPKRGFLPHGAKTKFALVKVKDLSARFAAGSVVDPAAVIQAGLIKRSGRHAVPGKSRAGGGDVPGGGSRGCVMATSPALAGGSPEHIRP